MRQGARALETYHTGADPAHRESDPADPLTRVSAVVRWSGGTRSLPLRRTLFLRSF